MSWLCNNCEAINDDNNNICEVCNSVPPSVSDISLDCRKSQISWTSLNADHLILRYSQGDFNVTGLTSTSIDISVVETLAFIAKNNVAERTFRFVLSRGSVQEVTRYKRMADETAWSKACNINTLKAFQEYLKLFPCGVYRIECGKRIKEFQDDLFWVITCRENTLSAYKSYKSLYPYGRHIDACKLIVVKLEDEDTWKKSKTTDTRSAYTLYLRKLPNGRYCKEAAERLRELEEIDNTAWNIAVTQDTLLSYERYRNAFPEGLHSADAILKIKEQKEWHRVYVINTIEAYQHFIDSYPNSSHVEYAIKQRDDLLDRKELDAAKRERTIKAIDRYINNHHLGKYLPEAYDFRRNLVSIEEESSAWKIACSKDSLRAYRFYLKKHPGGAHIDEAHKKIKELSSSYWLLVIVLCIIATIGVGVCYSGYNDFIDDGDDPQVKVDNNGAKEPSIIIHDKKEETIQKTSNWISESEIIALEKETETLLDGMEATKKNGKDINPDYRSKVEDNLSKLKRANSSEYLKLNQRYEAL